MSDIKIVIDGKELQVAKGSTVLEAAKELGVTIPTLCHLDLHDTKKWLTKLHHAVCVLLK